MALNKANAANAIRTWFRKRAERLITFKLIMLQACDPVDVEIGHDNKARFFKIRPPGDLSETFILDEEGSNSADQAIIFDFVERVVPKYGAHVKMTEDAKHMSPISVMKAASDVVNKQSSEAINGRIHRECFLHGFMMRADNDVNFFKYNVTGILAPTQTSLKVPVANIPGGATAGRYDGAQLLFRGGAHSGVAVHLNNTGAATPGHTVVDAGVNALLTWSDDVMADGTTPILPAAPATTDTFDLCTPSGLDDANVDDLATLLEFIRAAERTGDLGFDPGVIGKMNRFWFTQISRAIEFALLTQSGASTTIQDLYKYTEPTDLKHGEAGQAYGMAFVKDGRPRRSDNTGVINAAGELYSNFLIGSLEGESCLKHLKMWTGNRLTGLDINVWPPGAQGTDLHKEVSYIAYKVRSQAGAVEARGITNVITASKPLS